MNILNFSKVRTELMGVAMLLVVFHHLPIPIHTELFSFIKRNSGFGVDIFLLLSGIGLCYSTYKEFNLYQYIIKRFIRIFPIYAIIICFVSFINLDFNFINLFYKITTIGWWSGNGAYDWFIPNLIIMYILFPFLRRVIIVPRNGVIIGLVLLIISYITILLLPEGSGFQELYRYPIFVLGIILGKIMNEFPEKKSKILNYSIFITFFVGFVLCVYGNCKYSTLDLDPYQIPLLKRNGWLFLPYIWMVTGFSLFMSSILLCKYIDKLRNLLKLVGSMSIEVYLIHGQFIILTRYLCAQYGFNKALLGMVLIVSSFFVSYVIHNMNLRIMNSLKERLL